jgi:hypothetical protein
LIADQYVILGELDQRTNPDCEKGVCADLAIAIGISNVTIHPLYHGQLDTISGRYRHFNLLIKIIDDVLLLF